MCFMKTLLKSVEGRLINGGAGQICCLFYLLHDNFNKLLYHSYEFCYHKENSVFMRTVIVYR